MFRLFSMLLGLPWPVMALIAAGLFWAAQDSHKRVTAHEAEKAQALQAGAPAPVALDAFTEADVHLVDEVHVTAWINTDHNYELTKERKGPDTVRRMYVLFGPGDGPDSKVARGVVVLHPDRMKDLTDLLAANVADPADPRFLFHLNGSRDETPDLSYMVAEALAERGLMKDADFLAVEPYLDGREVALAPDEGAAERNSIGFSALGVLAGLLALGKFWGQRRQAKPLGAANSGRPVPGGVPMHAPEPMAGVPTVQGHGGFATPGTGAWSPIEAVKAKQMAMGEAAYRPQPSFSATAEVRPARSRVGLRAAVRTARNLSLAALLYGGIYIAFGPSGGALSLDAMMTGMDVSEGGSDPFAVGLEQANLAQAAVPEVQAGAAAWGDGGEGGGPTVPMPQGIVGTEQPLPQIGDTPPTPADQVQEDIAAGMSPADAIRGAITAEFPDETGPSGPVFLSPATDEPAAEAGLMQRLRDLAPQGWGGMEPAEVSASVAEGGLWKGPVGLTVLLALGSVLATIALTLVRRARQRVVAAQNDPWARIADRLQ